MKDILKPKLVLLILLLVLCLLSSSAKAQVPYYHTSIYNSTNRIREVKYPYTVIFEGVEFNLTGYVGRYKYLHPGESIHMYTEAAPEGLYKLRSISIGKE